ncbi:MAG: cytochrome P460 family protein [Limnobacter sp.]|nr:cytochrome P460 family protein [Limnobacter sp.]
MKKIAIAAASVALLAACASSKMAENAPKDGEVGMPSNYQSWPVFVSGIEKSSGHIRDIYINQEGTKTKKGENFPNGTQFVMEIYKADKGTDGKLSKTQLEKVFVMAKGEGWGVSAPEGMKNGDWIYSAFDGKGQALKPDYGTCRGCHLPLTDKDYVFHYDKYFDMKASLDSPSYADMLSAHAGMVALNNAEATQASALLQ